MKKDLLDKLRKKMEGKNIKFFKKSKDTMSPL